MKYPRSSNCFTILVYLLENNSPRLLEKNQWDFLVTKVIEAVSKTYKSDIGESRKLLNGILHTIDHPGFEIEHFDALVRQAARLFPHDPELVGEIYQFSSVKEVDDWRGRRSETITSNPHFENRLKVDFPQPFG